MEKKVENVVLEPGVKKIKLDRRGLFKSSKFKIGAISLALITVLCATGIPQIKGNTKKLAEFNVNLSDYDFVIRPDIVSIFGSPETEKIEYIDFSKDVSLSYNIINDDNIGFHTHPNNATLIDANPDGKPHTDQLFKDCKSALLNNFRMEIDDVFVDAIDVGKMSAIEGFENPRKHPMYKIFSNGEAMLAAAINVVPYRQVKENVANKASNPEGFTEAVIRIGNLTRRYNNFVGINRYEQDGVKLHGIVVQKNNGNFCEYLVLDNQYALEGKYEISELKELEDSDILFEEAWIFPGTQPKRENVYLVSNPFVVGDDGFYEQDEEFVYLRTEDNKIIKIKFNNVQLLGSELLEFEEKYPVYQDSVVVWSHKAGDKAYMFVPFEEFYTVDDNSNYTWDLDSERNNWYYDYEESSFSPANTIVMTFQSVMGLACGVFVVVDQPTKAVINLPNYQGTIDVLAYKLNSSEISHNGTYGFYNEYISLVFKSNIKVVDELGYVCYCCYNVPVEAVMLVGENLEAGYGITKTKTR